MKKALSLILTVVMLFSTFSCLTFTVSAVGDVQSISFESNEPLKLIENVDGFEYERDYVYFLYEFGACAGNGVLIVEYADGTEKEYVYDSADVSSVYQSGTDIIYSCHDVFVNPNDTDDSIYVEITSVQTENNGWGLGTNYFTLSYEGQEIQVPVTIVENPLSSVSFILAEPITLFEGKDGYDYGTYYEYELSKRDLCQEGNIFRISYSDGTNIDYIYDVLYEDEGFFDAEGNCLDIWGNWFLYSDQSEENQWTAGEHYFTLYDHSYNASTKIPVTIEETPVKSISYTPVEPIELIEKYDGESWVEYFNYRFPTKIGDILTVNYTDGTSEDYVFTGNVSESEFISSEGNVISQYDVYDYSNQSDENQWTVGNSYEFIISYMGRETSVPVTIVETPIKSISYTLREPFEFMEEVDGVWREKIEGYDETGEPVRFQFFAYDLYWWTVVDGLESITINYKDGISKTYYAAAGVGEDWFEAEDGEKLNYDNCDYEADRENWKVGSDNYFIFSYLGAEVKIPVTIVENPVASISYTPANPVELIKYADGYWSGYWLWNEEDFTEEYVEWFRYETRNIYKDGDIITVTYKDGTVTEYECWTDDGSSGWSGEPSSGFVDKDGNALPRGNDFSVTNFYDSQTYENQWSVGNEYELTFSYFGRQTTVPVKIVESPVESITFTPAQPIELVQGVDGYVDDMRDYFSYYCRYEQVGNTITLNYQDGTSKDFVYKATEYSFWWVSDNGEELNWKYLYARSDQYKNNWTEPGEYNFELYYMGAKTEVPVTLIENPVESISVELVKPIVFNWSPDVADNPDGTFYYVSNEILLEEGNKIILHYNDGSTKEYTWSSEAYAIYQEGWCDSDNNLLQQRVWVTDDQYENPWEIGDDNYIYVECMNKTTTVPVTLVACEHNWTSEHCYRQEPTCTEDGYQSEVCINCGSCREIAIPAIGHNYSTEWTIDKKATVNATGSKHKECTKCGEILETATIKQLKCSKPKLKTISNTTSGVKITWGKVSGADKYYVYRKTGSNGKYSKIATVKGNSKVTYTDKKAKSGKKYYYYVKAVNEAGSSDASKSKSILYLADTTLSTPKSTKNGVTLKWKKVTGAEGYVVYRKTGSGKYEKIATVKGNSKVTYTDKKAKKGKTYTYKIKAYKSKTTSAYSNAKKIKDKY